MNDYYIQTINLNNNNNANNNNDNNLSSFKNIVNKFYLDKFNVNRDRFL